MSELGLKVEKSFPGGRSSLCEGLEVRGKFGEGENGKQVSMCEEGRAAGQVVKKRCGQRKPGVLSLELGMLCE